MLKTFVLFSMFGWLVCVSANAAEVSGFKSASFGASEKEVVAAAVKDLGVSASDIKRSKEPSTRLTLLQTNLKTFEPLDVPAKVTYVLGYKCNCLVRVTVAWSLPQGISMDDRKAVMAGVGALVDHFIGQLWEKEEFVVSRVVGDVKEGSQNTLIFFRGQNKKGAGIAFFGFPVKMAASSKEGRPPVSYEANVDSLQRIILSYERDIHHQDTYHLDTKGF